MIYEEQLRAEVNAEREKLGKPQIEEDDDDDDEPPKTEKTVSTTDLDCGMFVKGEHERQFAYEAHTVCERHGFILDVEVTAGNINDSVAWDAVYDRTAEKFDVKFVAMDAGYKPPWIAKKTLENDNIPLFHIPDTKATKSNTSPGNMNMTQQMIHTLVRWAGVCGTPQQTKMENGATELTQSIAKIVLTRHCVVPMIKGRRYSAVTSGKSIWTLWSNCERQS